MKKTIILIILILIELVSFKIPKYVELNNLAIIEEIIIEKNNNKYTITLKEIIPIKEEQGINYKYKYYEETSKTIEHTLQKLKNNTKKKLYLKKAKSLITNITSTKEIINTLQIKPSTIIHTNNIDKYHK